MELFDIAQDPSEKSNLATQHPEKISELQKRAEDLARESAKPLFLMEQFRASKSRLHTAPVLPTEDGYFDAEP